MNYPRLFFAIAMLIVSYPAFAIDRNPDIGRLNPMRTAFDVLHYDIRVKIEPGRKFISGSNVISFRVLKAFSTMQLDLVAEMGIDSIIYKGKSVVYRRNGSSVIIRLARKLGVSQDKTKSHQLKVYFSGQPHEAEMAPWKGGFVWEKDSMGNDWVGLACEGIGASMWLPCKDHWSDEADGMDMYLTVPSGLTGVSNGRLLEESPDTGVFSTFHWQVKNTINNYNISINAGKYTHITDTFYGGADDQSFKIYPAATPRWQQSAAKPMLTLDYYVLEYNRERAARQFKQVHGMLGAFEHYFGPYPFYEDGYKLVETPYLGMEHQSCIAYGNNYKNTPYGFDFIIIHESGHEWFANSVTADDPADMWIHESFTTYSEALYLEYRFNKDTAQKYLQMQRLKIAGKEPLQGPRDVFYKGRTDSDIYYKGTWILHTMRHVINNDSLWFSWLRGFAMEFRHRIINTRDVISYFNRVSQRDWTPFFSQYLYYSALPTFDYKLSVDEAGQQILSYQWKHVVAGFNMPVMIYIGAGTSVWLYPTEKIKKMTLPKDVLIRVPTELFLINVEQ
jgi:aminopeptidase N